MLTDREQQIVDLLRRDPLMGSEALAAALGTTRASINVHISNLGKKGVILGRGYVLAESPGAVVIGGANMDLKARSSARATHRTSNPGHGSMAPGGVGRNIAENLARLGNRVHLVSVVGRDALGENLLEPHRGRRRADRARRRTDRPTGTYTAVLDADGELIVAIADMDATAELGPDQLQAARDVIATAGVLVLDGNLARDALEHALDLAGSVRTIFEPVSVPKAAGLKDAARRPRLRRHPQPRRARRADRPADPHRQAGAHGGARPCTPAASSSCGSGSASAARCSARPTSWSRSPPCPPPSRTSPAPATRCSPPSATSSSRAARPQQAARFGHAAAALTVASPHTVRPDLTPRLIEPPSTPPRREEPHDHPHPSLVLTDEVAQALADGAPVVALESTIISHGMPYPQNVEMATEVERIIREGGAVPATIAVLDGRARIGLDPEPSSCSPPTPTSPRSASATCPTSSPAAATAPPPWPRPCAWPRWRASASSSPAGSAAYTAGRSRPSTSAPTSPSCRSPTSRSSPPA